MLLKLSKHQRGDTIVEVLIAIVVISYTLSIGLSTIRVGSYDVQDSQERAEALKVAESQVELVLANTDNNVSLTSGGDTYCISESGVIHQFTKSIPANFEDDDFSAYPSECLDSEFNRYYFSVERDAADDTKFTARTRWHKINGGKSEVVLKYIKKFSSASGSPPSSGPVVCNTASGTYSGTHTIYNEEDPSLSGNHVLFRTNTNNQLYMSSRAFNLAESLPVCNYRATIWIWDTHDPSTPWSQQEGEQIFLRFLDASNNPVGETPLTDDLPAALSSMSTTVTFTLTGTAVKYQFVHRVPNPNPPPFDSSMGASGGYRPDWCTPPSTQCSGSIGFGSSQPPGATGAILEPIP